MSIINTLRLHFIHSVTSNTSDLFLPFVWMKFSSQKLLFFKLYTHKTALAFYVLQIRILLFIFHVCTSAFSTSELVEWHAQTAQIAQCALCAHISIHVTSTLSITNDTFKSEKFKLISIFICVQWPHSVRLISKQKERFRTLFASYTVSKRSQRSLNSSNCKRNWCAFTLENYQLENSSKKHKKKRNKYLVHGKYGEIYTFKLWFKRKRHSF